MQPKNQITDNPLKNLGYASDDILPDSGFGAVLARAGVGKTSFLVQIALNAMLRHKRVLHISLHDPVNKINLWYKEIFQLLTKKFGVDQDRQLWETILPFRFILTMKVDGFSILRLEERLRDLTEQNIFLPKMIIIDGLPFDESTQNTFLDLKSLVKDLDAHVWFTARTHRHESPHADGLPIQMAEVKDLFDTIILLRPEGNNICINSLKGGATDSHTTKLEVDPSTMLIREKV
ncbi:MAG: cytoplasmic protein [Deltaproteobacteria bacterium]|nr:cytoplasmic protein [Deltaproteobacteria bacterium]